MAQPLTVAQAEALRVRRVRARLKRGKERLNAFEYRLNALHADRTGAFRLLYAPPLIPGEFLAVERVIACNQRAKTQGCVLSTQWLTDTAEQRARIDTLRMTPLPERDPAYTGPMGYPPAARTAGKPRENYVFRRTPEEREASAAAYVERVMARERQRVDCASGSTPGRLKVT